MIAVSVIIPCFNCDKWIRDTLLSVAVQDSPNIEVIAINDGSTDRTAEIIEKEFARVKLLSTPNRGPSHARNLGTRLAQGEFIQYLDADDLLAPSKLSLQLASLQESGADVAYGDWQEFIVEPHGALKYLKAMRRQIEDPAELALFGDFWCPPAAYLFRRNIVDKVGGWSSSLPIIQDARFVLDCALYGARFVYTSEIVAYYRRHCSGSVSTRDSSAFVRDCLNNALEVEQWWAQHEGLDEQRRKALVKVYAYVARASFVGDQSTFEAAYSALERLMPGYVPTHPKHLAFASRIVGYRRAESLALHYRKAKKWLQSCTPYGSSLSARRQ
jgi:glycosyltransferase involved in cell wall biosynthesis